MQIRFALLAPALFASAIAITASLSAQEKPTDTPAAAPTGTAQGAQQPAATASASSEKPTAASVLERSVAAIGGKDAWSKVKSVEIKAQIELPGQGIKGPMQSFIAVPAKMVTIINFAGIGEIKTGFDGTVGWSIEPMSGPRLLEGGELEMVSREADMLKDADPMRRWDSVETVGEGTFAGFDCWKLEAVKGGTRSTLWYEKETGLQRGVETSLDTQMGKIPMSTALVEYREFEGAFGKVKAPVRTETTQMGQKMVTTVEGMTFDAVDPTLFELPAPIKALLEPEPSEEGDAPAAPAAPAQPESPKKEG